jgi:hypothetical protein
MTQQTPKPEAPFQASLKPTQQLSPHCGNRWWGPLTIGGKCSLRRGLFSDVKRPVINLSPPACSIMSGIVRKKRWWALPYSACGLNVIALISA